MTVTFGSINIDFVYEVEQMSKRAERYFPEDFVPKLLERAPIRHWQPPAMVLA